MPDLTPLEISKDLNFIVDAQMIKRLGAESEENRHLRELYAQLGNAVNQLIEQNKELWKLSRVVSNAGKDDSHE
jgi:ubiquinone biosynthesis protein COQ9